MRLAPTATLLRIRSRTNRDAKLRVALLLGLACESPAPTTSPAEVGPPRNGSAPVPAAEKEAETNRSGMLAALGRAIRETPYSAVVQHTGVKVVAPPRGDSELVFKASVERAIRGQKRSRLRYSMTTEEGDEPGFTKGSVIVTLCRDEKGFFWPGTGAEFPLTQKSLNVALKAAEGLPEGQTSFPACE